MEQVPGRKSRGKSLASLLIIGLLVLVVLLDARRRQVETQLQELTMRVDRTTGNPEQNKEAAKAIVEKVKKLIKIPDGIEPTVATIVDVEQLRARNPFYARAKNGDNLVVTPDRAILFDPVNNVIIDVVPVRIQQGPEGAAGQGSSVARSAPAGNVQRSSAAASVAVSAAASVAASTAGTAASAGTTASAR